MNKSLLGICYFFLLSGCAALTAACDEIPQDPTPVWSLSNRFALEMANDCNMAKHSLGISGCAVVAKKVTGNITFPAFYMGSLSLVSSNCKNIKMPTLIQQDNVVQLNDIYTATNGLSCSFTINRYVNYKDITFDNSILGRFYLKVIPDSPYYSALDFSVGSDNFNGVGWTQTNSGQLEATKDLVLSLNPSSDKGEVTVACANKVVLKQEYQTRPFTIKLPSNISCDYELSVSNLQSSKINLGTFIHEVQFATINLTQPIITHTNKKVVVAFYDLDVTGKKKIVVAVKIDNNAPCVNSHICSAINNKDIYTIRAITPTGRLFYGKFRLSTGRWELIK